MATFAAAFREIVIPALRQQAFIQGIYLGGGLIGWEEAYGEVLDVAIKRGALHLPSSDWDGLTDWICSELIRQTQAAEEQQREWDSLGAAEQWRRMAETGPAWREARAAARRRLARGA